MSRRQCYLLKIPLKKQRFYTEIMNNMHVKDYLAWIGTLDNAAYHKIRLDHVEGSWASAWLLNIPQNKHSIMSTESFQVL